MPSEMPKHLLNITLALIKSPAKQWMGENLYDALGNALISAGGEEAQQKLDEFLLSIEGTTELEKVAKDADAYFHKYCDDHELRSAFSKAGGLGFGDLEKVQKALQTLPKDLDIEKIDTALADAIQADLGKYLTPEQCATGAKLYREGLLRALAPLKKYTQSIIAKTVLENTKKLDALDEKLQKGVTEIKALLLALVEHLILPTKKENQATRPGHLPQGSYLPLQRTPIFTGRKQYLERLEKAFFKNEQPTGGDDILLTQAISGMGGIGKTQLAVEFAFQFGHRFKGVHWLPAAEVRSIDELTAALATCGAAMQLPNFPEENIKAQAKMTLNAWLADGPRLVIVDNLEDADAANAILPHLRGANIHLLVTSRYRDWVKIMPIEAVRLDEFSVEESFDFLRKYLSEERATDKAVHALAERLGHLPLALELAGRFLERRTQKSIEDYLEELDLQHISLSNWRAEKNLPNPTEHEQHVANTFALSWEAVDDEKAKIIFKLGGYFAPNLPLPFQTLYWAGEFDREDDFEEALLTLKAYALLKEDDSLHPLMAEFARLQDIDDRLSLSWAKAFAWQCYPGQKSGGIWASVWLAQHARYALIELKSVAETKTDGKENLPFHTAFLLRHFGDLGGAMKLYEESLEIKKGLGDLKGKSATLHAMAGIYVTRGDLGGAMKLYEESLEIKEGLGDLKGKSATLHEMAGIYVTRGDLGGAMKLYEEALEIDEGLGDLQSKSATLHEMAYILRVRGDLGGAMKLYEESLEIKKGLGDLKGKSATLHAMAGIYVTRGDLGGAMKLYEESLEIKEGLGDLKGKSATLHAMAGIYVTRGDLGRAMKLYEESLEIKEGLGDLKGKSATLHEMAYILRVRGDLDGAMKLYEEVVEIDEGLGDLKGKSATLHAMASIYVTRGDLGGAMKLYEEVLEILEGLGDLKGKSATLAMLAQVQIIKKENKNALKSLLISLQTLEGIGARPDAEKVASILQSFYQNLDKKEFEEIWAEIADNAPVPEWLKAPPQEQGTSVEDFIGTVVKAAKEKNERAEELFKVCGQLAGNANQPAEIQALGKVLQKVLMDLKSPDLSTLPDELAEMVRDALRDA